MVDFFLYKQVTNNINEFRLDQIRWGSKSNGWCKQERWLVLFLLYDELHYIMHWNNELSFRISKTILANNVMEKIVLYNLTKSKAYNSNAENSFQASENIIVTALKRMHTPHLVLGNGCGVFYCFLLCTTLLWWCLSCSEIWVLSLMYIRNSTLGGTGRILMILFDLLC